MNAGEEITLTELQGLIRDKLYEVSAGLLLGHRRNSRD